MFTQLLKIALKANNGFETVVKNTSSKHAKVFCVTSINFYAEKNSVPLPSCEKSYFHSNGSVSLNNTAVRRLMIRTIDSSTSSCQVFNYNGNEDLEIVWWVNWDPMVNWFFMVNCAALEGSKQLKER